MQKFHRPQSDIYFSFTSPQFSSYNLILKLRTGSPGLVVMGGDSCSEGREFDSLYFPPILLVKHCNVCLKRQKYMKKRPGMAIFKKRTTWPNLIENCLIQRGAQTESLNLILKQQQLIIFSVFSRSQRSVAQNWWFASHFDNDFIFHFCHFVRFFDWHKIFVRFSFAIVVVDVFVVDFEATTSLLRSKEGEIHREGWK